MTAPDKEIAAIASDVVSLAKAMCLRGVHPVTMIGAVTMAVLTDISEAMPQRDREAYVRALHHCLQEALREITP